MALDTVGGYISRARELLQDRTAPYRYSDTSLKACLGTGLDELRRLRPDITAYSVIPDIDEDTVDAEDLTVLERQYRYALVLFIVGMAQLRDDEDANEGRGAAFLGAFRSRLLEL